MTTRSGNRHSGRPAEAAEEGPPADLAEDQSTVAEMRRLPRAVGYALTTVGVIGVLVPGPIGAPFLVLGGLMLWPAAFRKPDAWIERRFPKARHEAITVVQRFMDDLDKRYPDAVRGVPDPEQAGSGRS